MDDDQDESLTGPPDLTLEVLVKLLNKIEDQTDGRVTEGITLCVKGLLISGIVISRKEFLRSHLILEQIDEASDQLESEGKIPKAQSGGPIHFIHLRNAHIFAPGQRPIPTDPNGTFWRGRLASVDGYFAGRLSEG